MSDKLNLVDLLHIAYRWMVLLIATTVLGGCFGFVYSYYFIKPTYTSSGNMYVSSVEAEYKKSELDNMPLSVLNASAQLAVDYIEIIEYKSVLEDVVAACDTDVTAAQVAQMLKATQVEVGSPLLQISVTADDPYVAYDVATAVLKITPVKLPRVAEVPGSIIVVEEASEAVYYKPNPLLHGFVGAILGFVLSALLILFIELMDNRLKQTDNISAKYNMPVIGVVPTIRGVRSSKE